MRTTAAGRSPLHHHACRWQGSWGCVIHGTLGKMVKVCAHTCMLQVRCCTSGQYMRPFGGGSMASSWRCGLQYCWGGQPKLWETLFLVLSDWLQLVGCDAPGLQGLVRLNACVGQEGSACGMRLLVHVDARGAMRARATTQHAHKGWVVRLVSRLCAQRAGAVCSCRRAVAVHCCWGSRLLCVWSAQLTGHGSCVPVH